MDKMSLAYCGCDEIEEFPLQDRSTRKAALCIPREALSTRQLKLVRSHEGSWVQSLDVRLRSWVSSPVVSSWHLSWQRLPRLCPSSGLETCRGWRQPWFLLCNSYSFSIAQQVTNFTSFSLHPAIFYMDPLHSFLQFAEQVWGLFTKNHGRRGRLAPCLPSYRRIVLPLFISFYVAYLPRQC